MGCIQVCGKPISQKNSLKLHKYIHFNIDSFHVWCGSKLGLAQLCSASTQFHATPPSSWYPKWCQKAAWNTYQRCGHTWIHRWNSSPWKNHVKFLHWNIYFLYYHYKPRPFILVCREHRLSELSTIKMHSTARQRSNVVGWKLGCSPGLFCRLIY